MLFSLTPADFSLDISKNPSVISHDQNVLASQNFARTVIHIWSLHKKSKKLISLFSTSNEHVKETLERL